jgi:hypothetical protein
MFEKKEDKIIVFSLALIFLFLLSTIVTYGSSFGTGASGSSSSSGSSQQSGSSGDLSGHVRVNCTLSSWDPVLIISGDAPGLDALVQSLKAGGTVVNEIKTGDGRLLRLSDSKYVFPNAYKFERLGLSAYSDAVIDVGNMEINSTAVAGNSFKTRMAVDFDQGDMFVATMDALAQGGQLVSLSNFQIAPSGAMQAELTPLNVSINSAFYRINVPWSGRNLNYGQFDVNMRGGSRIYYKPRSYVTFDPPLSDAQVSKASPAMPSYVQGLQNEDRKSVV